jgi:hypothetical protein
LRVLISHIKPVTVMIISAPSKKVTKRTCFWYGDRLDFLRDIRVAQS